MVNIMPTLSVSCKTNGLCDLGSFKYIGGGKACLSSSCVGRRGARWGVPNQANVSGTEACMSSCTVNSLIFSIANSTTYNRHFLRWLTRLSLGYSRRGGGAPSTTPIKLYLIGGGAPLTTTPTRLSMAMAMLHTRFLFFQKHSYRKE